MSVIYKNGVKYAGINNIKKGDIITLNEEVDKKIDKSSIISTMEELESVEQKGNVVDALVVKELNNDLKNFSNMESVTISLNYFVGKLTIIKKGNNVCLNYGGDINNAPNGSMGIIGTIPIGFIPIGSQFQTSTHQGAKIQISFELNGNISAYNYQGSAITQKTIARFNANWIC